MRGLPLGALALLALTGCGDPPYATVDVQLDLHVQDQDDPWAVLRGVRICVTGLQGGGITEDRPSDPGSYVLEGLPLDREIAITVQALDETPTELEAGQIPTVLASVSTLPFTLAEGGGPTALVMNLGLCDGDCPLLCEDSGGVRGTGLLGVRRVEDE